MQLYVYTSAGMVGASGVLVWGCACLYVCMYVHLWACDAYDAIAMEVEVEDSEDRRQCQNKSRDIEDG